MERVSISVSYPGASAEEIESGIIDKVELCLKSIALVESIYSTATPGKAQMEVTLKDNSRCGSSLQLLVDSIHGIDEFPSGVEQPVIRQLQRDD